MSDGLKAWSEDLEEQKLTGFDLAADAKAAALSSSPKTRDFDTGATRDALGDKLMFSRFMSPSVLRRYCEYLHEHRIQSDGKLRDPDNWKKGIDELVYIDSALRHFFHVWGVVVEGDVASDKDYEDALCAVLFNTMGLLYEQLVAREVIEREENV